METAVNLAWTAGSNSTRFGIAAKYQLDKDASISVSASSLLCEYSKASRAVNYVIYISDLVYIVQTYYIVICDIVTISVQYIINLKPHRRSLINYNAMKYNW